MSKERHEDALEVLSKLHAERGDEFIQREMLEIREQLALEQARRKNSSWAELFTLRYARRVLLGCFIMNMTKLSGSGIVQNYQSLFYGGLGFQGRTVLLISGFYGIMGVIGQLINIAWVSDKWPRRRTVSKFTQFTYATNYILLTIPCIVVGSITLALFLTLLMLMSKYFGDGSNLAGAAAGVAFVFLFSGFYAVFFNSTVWVLVSEIFPQHLRGNGNSLAVFSMSVTNIWFSQITPLAMEAIAWKFYLVMIATNLAAAFIYWMWLPETNQLSLEEIAGAFGDDIAKNKLDEFHAGEDDKPVGAMEIEESGNQASERRH